MDGLSYDLDGMSNYWLDLFTSKTWEEFRKAGSQISGFRERRWTTVQKIKTSDLLLCYLTGISRFVGILEVTSVAFQDSSRIWSDEIFPCRLPVKPIVQLQPEHGIPVQSLRDQLSIFDGLSSPNAWSGHLRASPAKWSEPDGHLLTRLLEAARDNPVFRAVNEKNPVHAQLPTAR